MEIDNEFRFRASLQGGYNLFVGAGFSVNASSLSGPLPIGESLASKLRVEFNLEHSENLRLDQIATILQRTNHEALDSFLRKLFTVSKYDARYGVLLRTKVESIFTTNIDDLIPKIFASDQERYLNDVFSHGASLYERTAVDYVALHGCVSDDKRALTFSTLDIAAARTSDPDQWNLFRHRIQTKPTFFWGYSMADSGTLEAVRATGPGSPTEGDAWIQVRPGIDSTSASAYFRALGFQVVLADTDEVLDFLADMPARSSTPQPSMPALANVPAPGSTVARPIEDYFLGYPATWSDIYSQAIAHTSHLRSVQNRVAEGKSAVITGIPGCGKSTLLMQLAAYTDFPGPKLIFDGLPAARAELLARQIGSTKALIFLDNVTSDFRSFEILRRLPNVVLVACDRDYNLGSVSGRLQDVDVKIFPVSDLTPADLQYLWDAIPKRIRVRSRVDPKVEPGIGVSAFEFILSNVSQTPLGDKLIEYIQEMHSDSEIQSDLLLAASYLQYCRTVLTMDVVVALARGRVNDYRELYGAIDQLGALLTETLGREQDQFSARSMLVAEFVLQNVSGKMLKSFLVQFHNEVSPLRVNAYDTFRRRAFNWRIFSRAFQNAQEGIEIYDLAISRDDSPEILQQKALYLADKRLYEEAFFELDQARSSRRRKSWSIENSFFNVLFKANIDRAVTDPESRWQCEQALRGLDQCYSSDRRKGMHALTYGECAKTYVVRVDGEDSGGFLPRAEEMLTAVVDSETWLYRPPILLRQIRRARRGLITVDLAAESPLDD